MARLRKPKHLSSGFLFIAISGGCYLLAQDLSLGSSRNMGPGYFPTSLIIILLILGLVMVGQSFYGEGEERARTSTAARSVHGVRAAVTVLLSIIIFGLLVRPAGLAVAIFLSVIVGTRGMSDYPLRTALVLAFTLSFACCLVFVVLLGLPISLFGTLFDISR